MKQAIISTATFLGSIISYKLATKHEKDKIQYLMIGSFIGSITGLIISSNFQKLNNLKINN